MRLELLLRHFALSAHTQAVTSTLPRPAASSIVIRSGAAEPVRVLLVGSGITTGWGVRTHGLGLAGALREQVQQRLTQQVDLEQVGELGALIGDASRVLGGRARERWDVIVVAFGLTDAVRATPMREWAQGLDRLLAKLDGDLPRGLPVPIVVVGVPPAPLADPGLLGPLYRWQAGRMNAVTERAVARNRRVAFAALPVMANRSQRPEGSPEGYRSWAAEIAARIAPLLPFDARTPASDETSRRVGTLLGAVLDPVNAVVRVRLQEIAAELQAGTDADLVQVNLLDRDQLWSVANSFAGRPRSVPVAQSFWTAVDRLDVLHVADLATDPRFPALPAAVLRYCASYAGVALRNAHGVAVGSIGFYNGAVATGVDPAVLRRATRDVERQLARLVSVLDGGAIFAQRARTIDADGCAADESTPRESAVGGGTPAIHDAAIGTLASVAPPADGAESAPRGPGSGHQIAAHTRPLERRHRLRGEGRRLSRTGRMRVVPTGSDVRIQGRDPIRVLLVGGDYAVGYGTRTRAEALDGAVARLLHTRTGRGVVVENRSQQTVRLEQLAGSLGPAGAHTFDLVLWTPTFEEGTRVLLRSRWTAGLGLLLRKIEATSSAAVILVGFPSLIGNQPLAVIGRARSAQINRLLTAIARRARSTVLVEPPPIALTDVDELEGRDVYQQVAAYLLPAMIDLLALRHRGDDGPAGTPRPPSAQPDPAAGCTGSPAADALDRASESAQVLNADLPARRPLVATSAAGPVVGGDHEDGSHSGPAGAAPAGRPRTGRTRSRRGAAVSRA